MADERILYFGTWGGIVRQSCLDVAVVLVRDAVGGVAIASSAWRTRCIVELSERVKASRTIDVMGLCPHSIARTREEAGWLLAAVSEARARIPSLGDEEAREWASGLFRREGLSDSLPSWFSSARVEDCLGLFETLLRRALGLTYVPATVEVFDVSDFAFPDWEMHSQWWRSECT